jgi:hypothetical protein
MGLSATGVKTLSGGAEKQEATALASNGETKPERKTV